MVPIGHRPILWHIMHLYRQHGFKKFILCLGYKGEQIKDYFINYAAMNSDFTVNLQTGSHTFHSPHHDEDWEVTLAYTGEKSQTGARVAQATLKYLNEAPHAAVTYGDGLTDANLKEEFLFHLSHQKLGTVLGVNLPSRFGKFSLRGEDVVQFSEKPILKDNWINGGFFFFRREFFSKYLSIRDDCVLEKKPLSTLSEDGELKIFRHEGFWACMDTQRDLDYLNELWNLEKAPWRASLKEGK